MTVMTEFQRKITELLPQIGTFTKKPTPRIGIFQTDCVLNALMKTIELMQK